MIDKSERYCKNCAFLDTCKDANSLTNEEVSEDYYCFDFMSKEK